MKSSLTMNRTLFALCASAAVTRAALPEPDTVFYGRVLHLGGGEEYVMTSGELRWVVTPPAGSTLEPYEVIAQLSSMKAGEMSYQVRIPGVLATSGTLTGVLPGLTVGENTMPFRNTSVTVNGRAVRMADPAGGRYRPFWELTRDGLRHACARLGLTLTREREERLMNQYRHLSAFPENLEVLRALQSRGIKAGILSNGDPEMLGVAVKSAGFGGLELAMA